jgi:ATP adenylyltransferase
VDQQRLWAPWRLGYIASTDPPPPPPIPQSWQPGAQHDCFLCRAAACYDHPDTVAHELLLVDVGPSTVTLLNRYPYANGHLLVSPRRHTADLADLTSDEHLEAMQQLSRYTTLYRDLLRAQGFNIGLNLGTAGGAGVPGHLHWHLVPRWPGDNNFMASIGSTRVIPQSLDALWEALAEVNRSRHA